MQPTVTFPIRAAAIDVGSNAIRFLAAEFSGPDAWERLESVRAPVRLGHEVFQTGRLSAEVMESALDALEGFRVRMDDLGIRYYRAVATSAVRDSANGREFVERVWDRSGIRLEPITGREEARLVWLAIRERFDLAEADWVLVDLGGGSVEISLVDEDGVHWSESHMLGTVRLLEELSDEETRSPARFRRVLEDHTSLLKVSAAARRSSAAGLIATGGNIEALAELAEAEANGNGVRHLPLPRLREVIDLLAGLSPAQRVKELRLREDRADVILPAAVIYERVAALAGADSMIVPEVGVKEGILLDLVDDLAEHGSHVRRLEQEILTGAVALGRRYAFDEAHARQVAKLALSLFDQLAGEHGLTESDRRILLAAALLHDIGQFISYRRHHKHSQYLIANSELPGFTPAQIEQIALIARYHRRADPREGHEVYRDLEKEDRERVSRLAALLRVADALDREHLQQISEMRARVEDDELRLAIAGRGDLIPEQWALKKKAQLFERLFDLDVRLAVTGGAS